MPIIRGNPDKPHLKIWMDEQQTLIEEKTIAQAFLLLELPFIFKHVALMPDAHVGIGSTVGTVFATKGAIVPASIGVDIGCFRGDTRIPLLDGSMREIAELATRKDPFWVYSVTPEGQVVPGKARAMMTRTSAPLIRVVISGGEEIFCTPDHEFMLLTGEYRRAENLKFNDSLMPLYRAWNSRDGYESCSSGNQKSNLTHKLVHRYFHGPAPAGEVIHHKDHNHFNNTPENLQRMGAGEHSKHHRAAGHVWKNADPNFQEARKVGMRRWASVPENRKRKAEIATSNIKKYMGERGEHYRAATRGNGKRGTPYLKKFNTSPRACPQCGLQCKNPSELRWHVHREHTVNHKVVSVVETTQVSPVYCLQVEEHHNFALAAGVFVHNCGMSFNPLAIPEDADKVDPEWRKTLYANLKRTVPSGFPCAWPEGRIPPAVWEHWDSGLAVGYQEMKRAHPKLPGANSVNQLGTLGGGNHFIEIVEYRGGYGLMLHSGSRGIGNRIGEYFIRAAKDYCKEHHEALPHPDLAFLPEGTPLFYDYTKYVLWAQRYAKVNRALMRRMIVEQVERMFGAADPKFYDAGFDCRHNFVVEETHFGEKVWVTRKGAVRARPVDQAIIPGSMGACSYLVTGKGNPESFMSSSHGAGRTMSRGDAKRNITLEQHAAVLTDVVCDTGVDTLDESPLAYKDINLVMDAQKDLVEAYQTVKQIICVKGKDGDKRHRGRKAPHNA